MQIVPYILEVDGQEIILTPDVQHEYLVTTEQVALGYDTSEEGIRSHKARKTEELVEGKHWVTVANSNGGASITLWTKRGIVRLGFFIRSARARKFRDLAEDLVIADLEKGVVSTYTPALISARLVAVALDCSSKSATNRLRHRGIDPTDHFLDPVCGAPTYLYPLAEVQKVWSAVTFQPYTGLIHAGTGEVQHRIQISKQGKAERNQHLFFTVAEELGAQLAREMVETFIRDELPKRFRAVFGSQVSA
jgi:hypothetical protein